MRIAGFILSVAGLACCTGCIGAVAGRGLAEVRGASAEIYPLKAIPAGAARSASQIKIAPVEADGASASEFRAPLQAGLHAALAKAKTPSGSGGALTIRSIVRFYEGKGASKLVGGMALAIARIEVVDREGTVIGKADALASTKALRTGEEDLAEAMAKEIIEWVTQGPNR